MHQLIILGNGFDLTCGLKSKFSDFTATGRTEQARSNQFLRTKEMFGM